MTFISLKLVLIGQCPDRWKWHFRRSSFQIFSGGGLSRSPNKSRKQFLLAVPMIIHAVVV